MKTDNLHNDFILQIKNKLKSENVNIQDFNKCIEVLSKCVCSVQCIAVYKDYVYDYNN